MFRGLAAMIVLTVMVMGVVVLSDRVRHSDVTVVSAVVVERVAFIAVSVVVLVVVVVMVVFL